MAIKKFYVGDLCYVFEKEWETVLDFIDGKTENSSGDLQTGINGKVILNGEEYLCGACSTMYGDWVYQDQFKNNYAVDSGTIGFIELKDLKIKSEHMVELGEAHVFEMEEGLICKRDGEKICIGKYEIEA